MKMIESFGNNATDNIVIESDNLPALDYLKNEFKGKVDVIIIDPPYNTDVGYIGYKDSDFKEGWGKFMKDRLTIAKELMSPTGVMYINIDENELVTLMSMCYGLFEAKNVNVLVWPKIDLQFDKNRVEKPTFNVKSTHEYIVLCYMDKMNTVFGNTCKDKPLESIVSGFGTTSSAKDEICTLLGSRDCFSTPKPVALVKELIRVSSKRDSIVLDFFAGSGTTGHAVMDLNDEDGGTRKFILVTNNESNICRNVTIPRLNAAIVKHEYDAGFSFLTMDGDFEKLRKE